MSDLRVTNLRGRTAGSAPNLPDGVVVNDTTQSTSANTGAVVISGGVGIGKSLHVGGNVSVGGTLTYEDVKNIDSIGIITGRSDMNIQGNATIAGILTATTFSGIEADKIFEGNTEVETIDPSASTYSINVTASGSSNYTLSGNDRSGSVSGSDPTVTVNIGDTLNFVVNASGHPLYIRVADGGANVSTPAATNQGSDSGTVSWIPNAVGTYYYQCGNHAGMIGTITVTAGHIKMTTEGSERVRVGPAGQIGLSGANYGDSGQFLTSGGSGAAPTWTTVSAAPTASLVTSENLVAGDSIAIKTNGEVEKVTSNITQTNPLGGSNAEVSGSPDGDESSSAFDPFNPTQAFEIHRHQNARVYSRIGTIRGNGLDVDANTVWANKGTNISPVTTNGHEAVSLCNIGSGKYLAVTGETTAYARVVNVNYAAATVTPESGYATLNGGNDCRNWDVESYGTDKAVICYRSNYDSKVYVVGVSVSGNTVTLGTPVEFDASTNLGDVNIRRVSNGSKFLATWYKDSSDGMLCRMGNLDTSTNTVTQVGNELTLEAVFGTPIGVISALTYTKDNKWISAWKSVSGYFKGAVISYDGNTTITRGTILQISGNLTSNNCLVYDSEGGRTVAFYEDRDSGSGSLRIRALTVSGTTLTATSDVELSGQNDCHIGRRGAFYAPYWGTTYGICEQGGSNRLFKFMMKSSVVTSNLDKFVGFVGSSFSSTSTATIQVVGNINANQSGLTPGTKYYIQKDGTLSSDEANPSIYAGTAISATSLLIKG